MNNCKNRMAVTKIKRNERDYTALIVLDEHRKFTELSVFKEEDNIPGSIVIARVDKVVKGINAAFVHISPDRKAYLPLEHLENAIFTRKQSLKKPICEGDELIVQVIKEAVKTKDPVVSSQITLAGKYSLLITSPETRPESNHQEPDDTICSINFSISRKIKGEARKNLKQFIVGLQEELKFSDTPAGRMSDYNKAYSEIKLQNCGMIEIRLRTNSIQANYGELSEDIRGLIGQWNKICEKAAHQSAYSMLNIPLAGYIRHMQSLSYDDIDCVYTDSAEIYDAINETLPYLKNQNMLKLYNDSSMPLSVLYNISGNIESLTAKKVWLPSGGNLIIEQVETMTVIDVNSAKSSANHEAMLKANMEAAVEIPRQLRLRNISGMIIVDFINMDNAPEDEMRFINILKEELRKDTVPANFIDITKLGLVEITRKKIYRSLKEMLSD